MKIRITSNAKEVHASVRAAMELMAGTIRVTLAIEDRSLTIIYYQARAGRDVLEAFGDIDDNEIEQLYGEALEHVVVRVGDTRAERRKIAEALGELLRKYLLAGVDDEDLIDTGRLRADIESASVVIEGA